VIDGAWHRLHPASPLLRGGIALIAILGVVIANLRERLMDLVIPGSGESRDDPIDYIVGHGLVGLVLLGVAVLLLLLIGAFFLAWRMHTYRITSDVVEVRSGILFRTSRRARLDRIQGINIVRPFFARIFGAAKLEISQAGHDANLQLAYLSSAQADALRREILLLASGSTATATAAATAPPAGSLIDRRMGELVAPELDPDLAPPESVVKIDLGRLLGSLLLSGTSVAIVLMAAAAIVWVAVTGHLLALAFLLPAAIGVGSFYVRRFTKSLRYSVAGTPDGVRVGFGLLSTSNETLPPGRIHSIRIAQPLLWRPAGWWEISVNRAGRSSTKGAAGQPNTTILPVGDLGDVRRVLGLILPDLLQSEAVEELSLALTTEGGDRFTVSPPRAAVVRPLSWHRNGFALAPGLLLLRKGIVWRQLVIVPQARLQSISLEQGPLLRLLTLARVHLHTVAGPVQARLTGIDGDAALAFFERVAVAVVRSADSDSTHRWGAPGREGAP